MYIVQCTLYSIANGYPVSLLYTFSVLCTLFSSVYTFSVLCTLSYGPVLPRSSTFTAVPAYLVWTATDCELVKTFRFSRSCSGDTL